MFDIDRSKNIELVNFDVTLFEFGISGSFSPFIALWCSKQNELSNLLVLGENTENDGRVPERTNFEGLKLQIKFECYFRIL